MGSGDNGGPSDEMGRTMYFLRVNAEIALRWAIETGLSQMELLPAPQADLFRR